MDSESQTLHMLFFPLMAPGHMLPMVDMAKLVSARGLKSTVLTTPGNLHLIQPSIDHANDSRCQNPIQLHTIPFPSVDGIPVGCENMSSVTEDLHVRFFAAFVRFREHFVVVLEELRPDCIVTDVFFPWTADVAAEHRLPRILFNGSNFFSNCAYHSILEHKILESSLPSQDDSFVIPGLPHRIQLHRAMVLDIQKFGPAFVEIFQQIKEAESKNFGTVTNTFYELEPDYADYFRSVMGRRAWAIGPLSLCNKDVVDKSRRGNMTSIDREFCLNWLDSKEPCSVVYVCFGSLSDITTAQLREIAVGLEASNHPFIWVVRIESREWMPEGFEERIAGRGMIIRGWAPQILILNHKAVGGFLTHCGWNSCLEGISAGLPLITWPLFAEQFFNERLIVDVLKIGIAIGSDEYVVKHIDRKIIEATTIEATVNELMSAEEDAKKRRRMARELSELAFKAVEKGGSSYNDLNSLIAELMENKRTLQ